MGDSFPGSSSSADSWQRRFSSLPSASPASQSRVHPAQSVPSTEWLQYIRAVTIGDSAPPRVSCHGGFRG